MTDEDAAAWLVSEYVYTADGQLVGIIRQRHHIQVTPEHKIRVRVMCQPELASDAHPLNTLAGEWVFYLDRDEGDLLYEGPDIVGVGRGWGERTLTSVGRWLRADKASAAFSIVIAPDRQVVGTRFDDLAQAGEGYRIPYLLAANLHTVAKTIGIATPLGDEATWPRFEGPTWPGDVAARWQGAWHEYGADGELRKIVEIERLYTDDGWEDYCGSECIDRVQVREYLTPEEENRPHAPQRFRRYGWALEFMRGSFIDSWVEQVEVLDTTSATLTGFRRALYAGGVIHELGVEVLLLKPEAP